MALVLNGVRTLAGPASHRVGASALVFERTSFQRGGPIRNFHSGEATGANSATAGYPNGYEGSLTWSLPRKGGGLATHGLLVGEGDLTATITAARLMDATLTGSGELAGAVSLVVSLLSELSGSGDLSASMQATLSMAATLAGQGDLTAALGMLVSLEAALSGSGTLDGSNLTGRASLAADIRGYGELTPEGLRDAVWNAIAAGYNNSGTMGEKLNDAGSASNPWTEVIESGFTAAEILRLIAAAVAGKLAGAEGETVTITGLDGATDRIVATVDEFGNRTAVTHDGT